MTRLAFVMVASLLLALTSAGCGGSRRGGRIGVDSGPTDSGPPSDSPTPPPTDSGPRDSGGPFDSGGPGGDPCAANDTTDNSEELATVGCNGAPRPGAPNQFGGTCTVTDVPEGSCVTAGDVCGGPTGGTGICYRPCDPGPTYVSTGGCPSGSRCFAVTDGAYCFPDCRSPTDCAIGTCDPEGSCVVE